MNNKPWDKLWINGQIATMQLGRIPYGLLVDAALAVKDGRIVWIGPMQDLREQPQKLAHDVQDVAGRCITPGLIDCHTHLVYAGQRSHEFALRLAGQSYEAIARAGGGIHATVRATRQASEEELFHESLQRARALLLGGVTTLEIKSGYGLDLVNELKILRVAKRIGEVLPVTIRKTFLGAHTLPMEYQGKAEDYIALLCHEMIPAVAQQKLADSVDVFCESIGFNLTQTEQIFNAAKKYHLPIRCHAEQLSSSGSAAMAAKYQALSVDHLEFLTEQGVQAMAQAGTVAVLLPGAYYFLQESHVPPVALLRRYNVPIAVATDCNPGTSPVTSLLLMSNMACVLFGLTPEEALTGVTCQAARALGMADTRGTLAVGKVADFVVWEAEQPEELVYHIGLDLMVERVVGGVSHR